MYSHSDTSEKQEETRLGEKNSSLTNYKMKVVEKSNFPYFLFLFLISPFLGAMAAAANFKDKAAKIILLMFFGVFGYTLILIPGKDSHSHAMNFIENYYYMGYMEFQEIMVSIMTLGGGKTLGAGADEPFLPILSYMLAQFTNAASFLFLISGLVYGFFFIKGISLVYSDIHRNWNIALLILFVFFVSWKSLDGINVVRNWTGMWIFFNGAYLYLKTRNLSYILLVLLAPMFHAGYLVITLPFFGYLLLGDRKYLLLGILIFSYFFSASAEIVEPYLASTGLGEAKMDAYVQEGDGFVAEDNRSFHARYYLMASGLVVQGLFIYALLFMGYLKDKNHDAFRTSLASVSILMLSFANISGFASALSNRVFINFGLFAFAYLLLHYSKLNPPPGMHRNVIYVALPGILLFLFTQYSLIADFMDFRVFVSPLVYPFLGEDPVSIKEFIRTILNL